MGLLKRLQGEVRVQAETAFPERILNLCAVRGLSIWDLQWESPTALSFQISRGDHLRLRAAVGKLPCTLTVLRRRGAPFALGRALTRPWLLTGLMGVALTLFVGSFFVWDYQVEGNETVPTERILRALEGQGVRRGSFGMSLDGEDIRNHVLLEIPELSYIAVNVSGCRAQVQVRERVAPMALPESGKPGNVVARRPGLILDLRALRGSRCAIPGMVVDRGQLLISGVMDTDTVGASVGPSCGSCLARTWYTLETKAPLKRTVKSYTEGEKRKFSLRIGTKRLKFYGNSSVEGWNCDKLTRVHPLSLFGIPLPLAVETECYRHFERREEEERPERLQRQLEGALERYLDRLVSPGGKVQSTLTDARRQGDSLRVTLKAECREEIGRWVPLYQEDPGTGGP